MKMPRLGWEEPPPREPLSLQFVENMMTLYNFHKRLVLGEQLGIDTVERTQHIYFGPGECAVWIYKEENGSMTLAAFTRPPVDLDDEGEELLELTEATLLDIPVLLTRAAAYYAAREEPQ